MKKITRASLEELRRTMATISQEEQSYYLGGGNGTRLDPYTYDEYLQLQASGSWNGGFVRVSPEFWAGGHSGSYEDNKEEGVAYIIKDVNVVANGRILSEEFRFGSGYRARENNGIISPIFGANYLIVSGVMSVHAQLVLDINYDPITVTSSIVEVYVDGSLVWSGAISKHHREYIYSPGTSILGECYFDISQLRGFVEIFVDIGYNQGDYRFATGTASQARECIYAKQR